MNFKVFPFIYAAATYIGSQAAFSAVGLTSAGIAGGSIAATVQSVVYGGATAGAFAAAQSAGAAGLTVAAKAAMAAAAAGAAQSAQYRGKNNERKRRP